MPRLTIEKKAGGKSLTVAQRLDRIIKSARQIMRKDKGLNGDLDRLPMLTWIMFLKFLDDMEGIEETRGGRRVRLPPRGRGAVALARLGGSRRRDYRRRSADLPLRRGDGAAHPARGCSHTYAACAATTAGATAATWWRPCSGASPTAWRAATCCATWSTWWASPKEPVHLQPSICI